MRLVADRGHTVIVTSDHGTIQVDRPVRVQGDRETSSNLRYKTGRNLGFNPKEVFAITKPEQAHLPKSNITSTYIFAYNRDFFAIRTIRTVSCAIITIRSSTAASRWRR